MNKRLKSTLSVIISLTRYPKPLRELITRSPVGASFDIDTEAQIARRCEFSGQITLKKNVQIGAHSVLNGCISIDKGTNLNGKNELHGDITIGKHCAIAPSVMFRQHNHMTVKPSLQARFYRDNFNTDLQNVSNGPITIGNDVWLGARSIVLSGVTIGDGAIVAAGAIVTEDVDPYSVVAGVPAAHKKWRFRKEIREELCEVEWWNWSEEKVRRNKEFFETDLSTIDTVDSIIHD